MKYKIRAAILNKLPRSAFARDVVTLMTGTTVAQILTVVVAPILTRLYKPEDYGINSLFGAILGIFEIVACCRYEPAIVLPEKDEDAANLLALSITVCFGLAVIILGSVALFRYRVATLVGAPELAPWLWFMPISLIATGLFMAFKYWSTRRHQFKRLAARTITASTLTAATQMGAGLAFHPGPAGLITGGIIGPLMATGQLAWQIIRDEGRILLSYINRADIKRMMIRYKDFPIYSSWSGMLNTASTMAPALLMGHYFNTAVVGYYALGNKVLTLPIGIVGGSIAQVFFPRAIEARRTGSLNDLTITMFKNLLSLGFVPLLLIAIVAPELFALVFGARWLSAGQYVRWLSPWIFFVFISSPLSDMFSIMEKQRDLLIFNMVMFIVRIIVLVIGGRYGNPLLAVGLFGITGVFLYMFFLWKIMHMAGVSLRQVTAVITQQILYGLPYGLIPIIVLLSFHNQMIFVLAGVAAGVLFLFKHASKFNKTNIIGI